MLKALVTIGAAIVLVSCTSEDSTPLGKAKRLHSQMVCTLPAGLQEHTPLLNISPIDSGREKLVREYIELERRRPVSEGKWDLAATLFYTEQSDLFGSKAIMQNDVEKVGSWLRNYDKGMELFKVPIDGIVEGQLRVYKSFCESYIKANQRYTAKQALLENLRTENKQPWLDPRKRLPCPVQQKQGCKP